MNLIFFYLEHVLVKQKFLEEVAEVVETDLTRIISVILGEFLLQRIGRNLAADLLHELLQLWQADRPLPSRILHGVEGFAEPSLLLKTVRGPGRRSTTNSVILSNMSWEVGKIGIFFPGMNISGVKHNVI